jgi:heme exporter protein A
MNFDTAQPLQLQGRGLVIRRGRRVVCRVEQLDLQAGQVVWLRGRNGVGKSSLIRALAGLLPLEQGHLLRHGARPVYLGHQNALHDDLTVRENLRFLAALGTDTPCGDRLVAALAYWELEPYADQAVRRLSQGLKRRTALARLAFSNGPTCWLLDEPYDALDQGACQLLGRCVASHAASGGAVLMSSHSIPEGLSAPPSEHWLRG